MKQILINIKKELGRKLKPPFISRLNKYLSRPQYFSHNMFLNRLNFQNLRMDYYNYLHYRKKFNSPPYDEISEELDKNGIVIIQNIFTTEEFAKIKSSLELIKSKNYFTFQENKELSNVNWLHGNLSPHNNLTKDLYSLLNDKFTNYYRYIEQIIRAKIDNPPKIIYQKLELPIGKTDINDSNAHFHADKVFPSAKLFFTLDDCKIENGPFGYIVGSHKRSISRRENDYINSINKTNYTKKKKFTGEYFINSVAKMEKFQKKDVICQKNSIIIANVMGYHKRGRLQPGNTREFLRILFYDYQLTGLKKTIKRYLNKKNSEKIKKKLS